LPIDYSRCQLELAVDEQIKLKYLKVDKDLPNLFSLNELNEKIKGEDE
jgi:hypothetical protein